MAVDPLVRLTFRRSCSDTSARHRTLLFCTELVPSPNRSLTVDAPHCLYFGVMNVWCRRAISTTFLSGVFGEVGNDAHLQTAVLVMYHKLSQWYRGRRRDPPAKPVTEVSDMTTKMVGSRDHPWCKTKGAETYGMMLFLLHTHEKFKERAGQKEDLMFRAGAALRDLVVYRTRVHSQTPRAHPCPLSDRISRELTNVRHVVRPVAEQKTEARMQAYEPSDV